MDGIERIEFDFIGLLKALAGGEWQETTGPRSRCGLDYWYKCGEHEAYINVDQDCLLVSIEPELRFEGLIGGGTLLDRFVHES